MLSVNLTHLIDDEKCYETVRQMRWTKCKSSEVIKRGKDETQPARQRYQCKTCNTNFDDLTATIFAGNHQPLRMWILCLYLMGLNLSNRQIAQELDLDKDVVQDMTTQLREGIDQSKPEVNLSGAVECDEVYVTAGHKVNPEEVKKKGAREDVIASRGGGGRLKKKNHPSSA
jgi:transposase-like protein